MKLKLTGKQFKSFTGLYGSVEFKDGVSVGDVNAADANLIASIVGATFLDGSEANECDKIVAMKDLESPYRQSSRPLTVEEIKKLTEENNKRRLDVVEEEQEEIKIYTKEELEAIADKNGIQGLREIASNYGITSNSISSLIYKILDRQREKTKKVPHYEDAQVTD